MYGLSTCPRICNGSTNSHEITAVVMRAAPSSPTQWLVKTNQTGLLVGALTAIFSLKYPKYELAVLTGVGRSGPADNLNIAWL
jgi:hypothetical protein